MYNGIEHCDDFGLELDMAFFRSYDPAIGRWMQIDPKYTYSQSVYSGMGNNPILYSDFLGDTTRVYGMDGGLMGTINDSHANQEHFIADDQVDNISHLLEEHSAGVFDADEAANGVRKNSAAFIGANTRKQLSEIAALGEAEGKERPFLTYLSSGSKELQVMDVSEYHQDSDRTANEVNLISPSALRGKIGESETLVGYGHAQVTAGLSGSSTAWSLRKPTTIGGHPDFQDHLGLGRDYPLLISTSGGYTVYSTKMKTYQNGSRSSTAPVNYGQYYNYKGKLLDKDVRQ